MAQRLTYNIREKLTILASTFVLRQGFLSLMQTYGFLTYCYSNSTPFNGLDQQ